MSNATQRTVSRWIHIVCGVPIIGYVYTPFEELHGFAWMIRYGFLPVLLLSGIWLWKGHVVKKLFSKEAA